jgi:hypothetical protein
VEGDGDRMAEVLRLVAVRDRRGGDELLLGLESIEIPLDNDAAAVAIADCADC